MEKWICNVPEKEAKTFIKEKMSSTNVFTDLSIGEPKQVDMLGAWRFGKLKEAGYVGIYGRHMDKKHIEEMNKICSVLSNFTEEMKKRLLEKLKLGYTGWNDPVMTGNLLCDLSEDVKVLTKDCSADSKKLLIDIANRAMMLYFLDDASEGNEWLK